MVAFNAPPIRVVPATTSSPPAVIVAPPAITSSPPAVTVKPLADVIEPVPVVTRFAGVVAPPTSVVTPARLLGPTVVVIAVNVPAAPPCRSRPAARAGPGYAR